MFFLHCFVCDLCVEVLKHSIEFVPMVSCLGSDTDPSLPLALMAPPSALLTSSCRSPVRGSLDAELPPCPSPWKRGPENYAWFVAWPVTTMWPVPSSTLGGKIQEKERKNHFCLLRVCLIIEKYRETHVTF